MLLNSLTLSFVNGKERVEIALEILPNDENVLNFCERIGYVYCKYREVRAKLVYSYLKYKLALKEKLKQKKKKILFLKGRGFKPNLISQKLDLPIRYVRYVYYKPDKITRASKYVPSFQDWVEEFTDGLNDGITWDIVERIAYSGRRKTADVFIKNFHNFIVNEFITHNCQTAVAYNELDYQEIDDIAVYVKFQLKNRRNEYLVIWTTTPWTLPANTGVMAKPDADYVKVR
ncbi:MAG: class I tRNA ligase family protein, partial [Thermoplasmata archaeon]